ncbi:MAG: zinc ribbon domain-containing protein [Coprothermobacterota bacterium]|nr:zinc ribbon domain-containing protein [Coprothermobacterota bacterium]
MKIGRVPCWIKKSDEASWSAVLLAFPWGMPERPEVLATTGTSSSVTATSILPAFSLGNAYPIWALLLLIGISLALAALLVYLVLVLFREHRGKKAEEGIRYCPFCGDQNSRRDKYCPACGREMPSAP